MEQGDPDYNPDEPLHAFMRRLILEVQDAEDQDMGEFGFSSMLPRVDGDLSAVDAP